MCAYESQPDSLRCDSSGSIHFFVVFLFETVSHYVSLAALELTVKAEFVSSNSERSACLCLQNVRIKGVHHHHPDSQAHYPSLLPCFFILS